MDWQRLKVREYSRVGRFDLMFSLTGDVLVSSPRCSVGWWGCRWSGWPRSRCFLELSRTVDPEFDCFRQDLNLFLTICIIMIHQVVYRAGIYDADIVSNVFVQTPPKEYDFYKKEKRKIKSDSFSLFVSDISRVHRLWVRGQFVRGWNPPQHSKSENHWLEKGAIVATQILLSVHVCIKSNILEGKKLCICKRTCKINGRMVD